MKIDEQFNEFNNNGPSNTSMAHDAGYDAYMTGFLFFHSCKVLKLNFKAFINKTSYGKVHINKIP